jgi:hypothetical protein
LSNAVDKFGNTGDVGCHSVHHASVSTLNLNLILHAMCNYMQEGFVEC